MPVIISELATGVTDGKLETQSGTISPRSRSSPKVGASSSSIALLSMSGCMASTTTRISFRCTARRFLGLWDSSEDPQALMFALGLPASRDPEQAQSEQNDEREGLEYQAQPG